MSSNCSSGWCRIVAIDRDTSLKAEELQTGSRFAMGHQYNTRLNLALHSLHRSGIIAYPTEAVFGLGCDPLNERAVRRLLQLKQRPWHKGLILIAASYDQLLPFIEPPEPHIMAPVLASWPGPSTWLLPAQPWVPKWIRGRHQSLAVRVSAHPLVTALCRAWGGPLISTSANRSNCKAARSPWQVRLQFGDRLDYLLNGPLGGLERPTSIRDASSGRLIRR